MSDRQLSRASSGLGGMAIALLLVGLVVQTARAATPCDVCQASADQLAIATCKSLGYPTSDWRCTGLRQGTRQKLCYQDNWQNTNMPACPGDSSVIGCEGTLFFDMNTDCPEPLQRSRWRYDL